MRPALDYVRHHVIAILALICSLLALAGASYASFGLPAASVGARQLRDNSITPAKFNRGVINGAVRAWAIVGASGRVIAGGGKPRVIHTASLPGQYAISWGVNLPHACATVANISGNHSPVTEPTTDKPHCGLCRRVELLQGQGTPQQCHNCRDVRPGRSLAAAWVLYGRDLLRERAGMVRGRITMGGTTTRCVAAVAATFVAVLLFAASARAGYYDVQDMHGLQCPQRSVCRQLDRTRIQDIGRVRDQQRRLRSARDRHVQRLQRAPRLRRPMGGGDSIAAPSRSSMRIRVRARYGLTAHCTKMGSRPATSGGKVATTAAPRTSSTRVRGAQPASVARTGSIAPSSLRDISVGERHVQSEVKLSARRVGGWSSSEASNFRYARTPARSSSPSPATSGTNAAGCEAAGR